MHIFAVRDRMGDGRFVPCYVIKIQNNLKYNFFGRVSLLQAATVSGIRTNWFEVMEGNFLPGILPGIFPTGVENWFEFAEISNNRGFEKSG